MFLGEIVSLKSDDEASLESDPLCGGAPERNAHHRPIQVNDLWNHIKEMKLNRCVGFKREYEVKYLYLFCMAAYCGTDFWLSNGGVLLRFI